MNSWQFNKIAGAVLGVIFLMFGGSLIAEGIFHSETPETPGFEVVVAEDTGGDEGGSEEPSVVPIAARMQEASADNGANQFKKCTACHSAEEGGENKIGPALWNVVNRPIGEHEGFSYSSAMSSFGEGGSVTWDYEHLDGFLENPSGYIDGTAMGFNGIRDPQDRADTIAYLRSLASEPAPLPEPPAEGEEVAQAEGGEEVDSAAASTQTNTSDEDGNAQAPGTTDTDTGSSMPGQDQASTLSDENQPDVRANEIQEQDDPAGNTEGALDADTSAAASGGGSVQLVGDPAAGERIFNRCKACHAVGEGASNGIGPELNGIYGEAIASVEGYSFSQGLQDYASENPEWTSETLHAWLEDPQGLVSGTKMAFQGLSDQEDRDDVIAYLATYAEDGSKRELSAVTGGSDAGGSEGEASGGEQSDGAAEAGSDEEANAGASGDAAAGQSAEASGEAAAPAGGESADAASEGETEVAAADNGAAEPAAASDGASGGEVVQVAGDPAAGEQVFRRCQACHKVGEGASNGIGPELNGVLGEKPGAVEGYNFSSNFQEWASDKEQWNSELMTTWLTDPRGTVNGTKMAFAGLKDQEDIDNVIAYLAQFGEDGSQSGN